MCKYSLEHHMRKAAKGDDLTIIRAKASHGPTYGVFSSKDDVATGGLICVPDNTILTLTGIPADLQARYKIASRETAAMVDNDTRQEDSLFFHSNGAVIPLMFFAHKGISVFVGVECQTDQAVADIIANADTAWPENGDIARDGGTLLTIRELVDA
jgi:hypothetical protein